RQQPPAPDSLHPELVEGRTPAATSTKEPQPMDESETGGVAAVIDRFEQHRKPELLTVTDPVTGDAIPLLAFSSGRLVAVREHLLPWRAVPDRREGTAEVQDLASFVALTVRHKD